MANKFRFTNEKCPVCNNTFKEDDDIAVCPECGTPHHRECYKQNLKCANHEKHSEAFRWEPDFVASETIEMPKVTVNEQRAPSPEQAFFSMQVHNFPTLLNGSYEDFEEGVKAEDVAWLVRQNAQRYIPKFYKVKDKKVTWNWGAFFLAPYWFFFRKVYKLGAIFLALTILLTTILPIGISTVLASQPILQPFLQDMVDFTEKYPPQVVTTLTEEENQQVLQEFSNIISENTTNIRESITNNPDNVGSIIIVFSCLALQFLINIFLILLNVLAGLMANKWYYNHTLKTLKKIQTEEKDPQKQKILFLQRGGISISGFFLAVLILKAAPMAIEMLLTLI